MSHFWCEKHHEKKEYKHEHYVCKSCRCEYTNTKITCEKCGKIYNRSSIKNHKCLPKQRCPDCKRRIWTTQEEHDKLCKREIYCVKHRCRMIRRNYCVTYRCLACARENKRKTKESAICTRST